MIMKKKQLLLLLLMALMCTEVRIFAQTQITPECDVVIEPDKYIIHFTLPNYWFENEDDIGEEGVDDGCGIFSEIVMEDDVDYDVTDEAGYPELPFFSINLLLPECASNVTVYMESSVVEQDYPPYYISPAQKGSWITENGNTIELDEECFNSEYYYNGYSGEYPNGFYRNFFSTSSIYSTFNAQGVTLSIFPFSYDPYLWYMDVLREATFVIEFDCGDLVSTIEDIQSSETYNSYITQVYFDTFNGMEIVNNAGNNGDYLIVAARRDMEESLDQYVYYKRCQNYNTEVIYLEDYGAIGDSYYIRDLIYFNDVLPYPDFVLLVGNLTEIPPYRGTDSFWDSYSDDGYHPFLGRWIIGEARGLNGEYIDLINVIDKTIQTETSYAHTYSTASLFSGTDNYWIVSRRLYRNIEKIANTSFGPMGIPFTLYDGRYFSPTTAQNYMKQAIQNHTRFFIYRGHGYVGGVFSGIASPYDIFPNNIPSFNNYSPTPMGFGFACSLNTYNTDYSFGARWVAESSGGVTFYGATTPSLRCSNNYLAKRMFKYLRRMTDCTYNFPISVWLRLSEDNYYWAFPTILRDIQIEKYNLMGDPTLYVYGMDAYGTIAPFHMPIQNEHNTQEELPESSSIHSVEVYDIKGQLIAKVNNTQSVDMLPIKNGVYIIKTIYKDGTTNTNKIIK